MSEFRDVAITAARDASYLLLELSKDNVAYEMKGTHDIQAEADLRSEKLIISAIKQRFPEHSILSEEAGEEVHTSEYLWSIDPLDGTINYERHIEEYCVSIALSRNDEIILGVICQPALSKLFVAEKGEGAYLNGQKLTIQGDENLINCIAATDTFSDIPERQRNFDLFAKISPDVRHMRIFGSSALHLARIAQGQLDFYFKCHYNHWDYAAGALILQEAGGVVTDMEGQPLAHNSKTILAATPATHAKALELIK